MLASKWQTKNEKMFPLYGQPKLDGIRVGIGRDGMAYTRSHKLIRSEYVQEQVKNSPQLIGLDAEIIVGDETAPDCYRRTSSAAMSYNNPDAENFKLHVFDAWSYPEAYHSRLEFLKQSQGELPDFATVVPTTVIEDLPQLLVYETIMIEAGHEGIILRQGDKHYKNGRGSPSEGQLIKMKRFIDAEGVIVACHEQLHNDNPAVINALGHTEHSGHKENLIPMGTLGAFELELLGSDNSPMKSVRVGTGLSHIQRAAFWDIRELMIGRIVKFKYFPLGVKDKPRFPVFLGFRDEDDLS
tara:strand:+ start:4686 stop:5579 length:894 start_codon:yes stop_codon:yes gene_type:complete